MQIRFFCWQSFVFPSFQFYTQTTEEEDVGKDWRTITFRQDHAIHLKKNSYCVFMCLRANRGECQHAVCHECHEKRSKAQKRSRGFVLSEDELKESCQHELCYLQICADMWWCTKDHLGGPDWFDRPKGCAFCERMFNVGDKWMRMFSVRKIRSFLFPVYWTSDLRVRQIEHLWCIDGQWRIERCHVLTVWVDVVVSFKSARWILKGFQQITKRL